MDAPLGRMHELLELRQSCPSPDGYSRLVWKLVRYIRIPGQGRESRWMENLPVHPASGVRLRPILHSADMPLACRRISHGEQVLQLVPAANVVTLSLGRGRPAGRIKMGEWLVSRLADADTGSTHVGIFFSVSDLVLG